MASQNAPTNLATVYGDLGGIIAKLRGSADSLSSSKVPLTREESRIMSCLEATKKTLIQQRVEISKLDTFDPISEEDASKKAREFAQQIRRDTQREVNLFCSDFEDHPIQALTDDHRLRNIIRLSFCTDLFEKIGLYSEDVAWVDILYRIESSITWSIKQVCSSPQITNPSNMLEVITWRWYRECVIELTAIMGLAERKPNPVLDMYDLIIELSIRTEKYKQNLKGA